MLPKFNDPELIKNALVHRSVLNERGLKSIHSNERLEFLGDAVLELATTRFLYHKFPLENEGALTAYRSALVKTTSLAEVAEKLDLGSQLKMSRGEEASGGRSNPGLLADTMEAVIGAIYLDQGFEAVEKFLEEHLFVYLDTILAEGLYKDAKSELQESVQSRGLPTPTYEVVNEVGPDHDKVFTVSVMVDEKVVATGTGKSKQQAQQAAAEQALLKYPST